MLRARSDSRPLRSSLCCGVSLDTLCECDTPVEAVGRAESKRGTVDQTRRQRQQGYDLTMQGDVNKGNLGFSVRSAAPLCSLVITWLELITLSDSEEQSTLPLDILHVRSLPLYLIFAILQEERIR